jgi:exodeoxyribonuclease V alpha subunit
VISGSPGTGKTTAITKIMALMLDMENRALRIALAAPMGKAAARLQESVKKTKEKLNCIAAIKEIIPNEAQTIHRLLCSINNSPYFQFNKKNPLHYDLVVVDEASMVDLPLLAKLIAALPPEASLILLGDKDQLASVEAGAVLGDLCGQGTPNIFSSEFTRQIAFLSGEEIKSGNVPAGIQDNIIHLQNNYRFPDQSGIGLLSQTVKNGRYQEAAKLLRPGKYADIHWTELAESEKLFRLFGEIVIERYQEYLKAATSGNCIPENIFDLFETIPYFMRLARGDLGY